MEWGRVDGVEMAHVTEAIRVQGRKNLVVQIPTRDGFDVFLTQQSGGIPADPIALYQLTAQLQEQVFDGQRMRIAGLRFPMVDYSAKGELSWLKGAMALGDDGRPCIVTQAAFEHRLRVNEIGARAQAAVAICTTRGGGGPPGLEINGPFLIWFARGGVPYFSAWITGEHMKEPRNLD